MRLPDDVEGLGSCEVCTWEHVKHDHSWTFYYCPNTKNLPLFLSIQWEEVWCTLVMQEELYIFLKGGSITRLGRSTSIRLILCGRRHLDMAWSHCRICQDWRIMYTYKQELYAIPVEYVAYYSLFHFFFLVSFFLMIFLPMLSFLVFFSQIKVELQGKRLYTRSKCDISKSYFTWHVYIRLLLEVIISVTHGFK